MASANTLDALGLTAMKAVVSGVVYLTGFRAISDDDFSRVVIAMRFAESPSLDPSGTSWLPLPFWLTGAAMTLFGSSLEVARAVAFLEGILGTLIIWQAARYLGLSRLEAWLGAAFASLFPYAAWLGVATVPEYLTAALMLFGVATASSRAEGRRLLGAGALALAALCRYEAWFVLSAFVLLNLYDAVRSRAPRLVLPALLASLTPAAWLLHGHLDHGSATFFLSRVAAYREAVGGSKGSVWGELASYPILLFIREPELATMTLVATLAGWRLAGTDLARFARPTLLLGALLAGLMVGAIVGGAPTHHPERAVLSIWMLACLALTVSVVALYRTLQPRHYGIARMTVAGVLLLALLVRYLAPGRQQFVTRAAEVALGHEARQIVGNGRVLIGSRDYGFFAVMAGFGAPGRAIPTDLRDPRSPRAQDCFASLDALKGRLQRERADALIAPSEHGEMARRLGKVSAQRGDYLLITALRP